MALTLRKLTPSDADTLAEWQTDALFCAHAGWHVRESPHQAVEWWREQVSHPDPHLIRLLALEAQDPVGFIDLHGSGLAERELGYLVAPSTSWGRGLGTAAARAGIAFGFDGLGLSRIWAEAVEANVASVKVLRRLGMRETGLGSAEDFLGQASRYVQFEISAVEWRQSVSLAAR
ncbi:GNAT family N-acetyltransferase [Cryobacterium roopkundense]|uniref:RimJ/RimL family protein N-acetyltransferase n=1 Tax=Cryobacterium roopkundense TaxID=1001240 RepID=A0A7W8ZVR9_9MICO|nr:GNAT family N-acetyltransferase [Cryobacterium roopkundense]MBB5641133.1 RimJ/RimL family protein N-acetyltransferase [Cryobacterium roopkundense]